MRVADRDDELADPQLVGVAELGGREVAALGAHDREVGERVAADDSKPKLAPVGERNAARPPSAADDVRGGEDEAVLA